MEEIVKLVEGVWIDKNGNAWNCEIFTKEEAIENSKSLESCFNCYNCKNCTECIKCSNCNNCENCTNCNNCDNCRYCNSCDNLIRKSYYIDNDYNFEYEYDDWNEEDYDISNEEDYD